MAYTKQDVIDTLDDSILQRMTIYADGLWINSTSFGVVRSHVIIGNIAVEEGSKTNAYYNSSKNKITTQTGSSPPDSHARGLLLHECTHALMDVYKFRTSTATNEVLCYIVQHLYLLHKIPDYTVTLNKALDPVSQSALWEGFYHSILDYARGGLHGFLAIDTNHWQFKSLRNHLRTLNIYQHLNEATMSKGDGV